MIPARYIPSVMPMHKVVDGVFAINKPKSITSAQVLRDLQHAFNPSTLFAPWLEVEREFRARVNNFQRSRRKDQRLQVKIGHGGTLDPLATGVLIIGVGKGTKQLPQFLECTKAYETALLFGVATDTYDVWGKVLGKADYGHITQELFGKALAKFKGQIMQRPPIYSALRMDGKRLYEYAREGRELPREIEERPVTVENMEIVQWLEGGSHSYKWPEEEAEMGTKKVADKVLHLQNRATEKLVTQNTIGESTSHQELGEKKRKRNIDEVDDYVLEQRPSDKRRHEDPEIVMSGGLQYSSDSDTGDAIPEAPGQANGTTPSDMPPAVKIRMTVTSGFYVRSLCHDLGKEVDSLGIMAELVRTRQGVFELNKNVLDYEDLSRGENVWGPKVERMLKEWNLNCSTGTESD